MQLQHHGSKMVKRQMFGRDVLPDCGHPEEAEGGPSASSVNVTD
jgi:hypothetical protein